MKKKRTFSFSAQALVIAFALMFAPTVAYAAIFGPTTATFQVGVSCTSTDDFFTNNNEDPPYDRIQIASGALPAGIKLDYRFGDFANIKWLIGTAEPGTVGTHTVTVIDKQDNSTIVTTITVERGPQTIAPISDYNVKMGDANFTVTPHSTNGNGDAIPVGSTHAPTYTFNSSNLSVATIDGNGEVTVVGQGTTTITVNSAATDSYLAASPITFDITVDETYYALTVVGGSGGGNYAANTVVTITANAAPGQLFENWTSSGGGTFADENASTTTFTMPDNDVTVTATYIPVFELTVVKGTDNTNGSPYLEGTGVSITADAPPAGQVFDGWTTSSGGAFANASAETTTFTMPANAVTVTATFTKTARQLLWESVMSLIENADFTVAQADAGTEDALRNRLAVLINQLLQGTGFSIAASDVVVFVFQPATAGDVGVPTGVNGQFEFRVSLPDVNGSAYNDGAITATPVANEIIATFRAWTVGGTLHLAGLTEGKTVSVYNVVGLTIYTVVATSGETNIPLPARGIYIVIHNGKTLKATN